MTQDARPRLNVMTLISDVWFVGWQAATKSRKEGTQPPPTTTTTRATTSSLSADKKLASDQPSCHKTGLPWSAQMGGQAAALGMDRRPTCTWDLTWVYHSMQHTNMDLYLTLVMNNPIFFFCRYAKLAKQLYWSYWNKTWWKEVS